MRNDHNHIWDETRPSPNQRRYILFVRSKLPFADKLPTDMPLLKRLESDEPGIVCSDIALLPFSAGPSEDVTPQIYGNVSIKDWVTFCEVVEVGNDVACATPVVFSNDTDFERDLAHAREDASDNGFADSQDRESSRIGWYLARTPGVEKPAFGRKLLSVFFEDDATETEVEKLKRRIQQKLGKSAKAVWYGRLFVGYCFADSTPADNLIDRMSELLDCDPIADYLIVQPISVPLPDPSGLSLLDDWVNNGFRK